MSTVKASPTVATLAVQIRAMCGDKQAATVVRMEVIRAAIVVALKGNKTQWMQGAAEVAKAKSTVEKAFRSGFMAVGDIGALYKPQDKVTPADKAEGLAARADELVMIFETAFLAEMPAEKTQAQKDAAKAEKIAKQQTEVAEQVEKEIAARKLVSPDALTTGDVVNAAIALIKAGKIGDTLADEMRAALGVEAIRAAAYAEGKAAALAALADKAAGVAANRGKVTAPAAVAAH